MSQDTYTVSSQDPLCLFTNAGVTGTHTIMLAAFTCFGVFIQILMVLGQILLPTETSPIQPPHPLFREGFLHS